MIKLDMHKNLELLTSWTTTFSKLISVYFYIRGLQLLLNNKQGKCFLNTREPYLAKLKVMLDYRIDNEF